MNRHRMNAGKVQAATSANRKYSKYDPQQLAAIVMSSHDAIVSFGFDDIVTSWNAGAVKMFGYSEEEAIGQSFANLVVPPEYTSERTAGFSALQAGEKIRYNETARRHKSGHLIPTEIVASPIFDENKKVVAVAAIIRDISERKHAADELALSQKRYISAIEDQTELLCRWASSGTLTLVNHAFCQHFSLEVTVMQNTSFYELFPIYERSNLKLLVNNLTPNQPLQSHITSTRNATASVRWIEWTHRLLAAPGHNGELIQSTGRDITDRYLAEEKLRESEKRYRDLLGNIEQGFCVFDMVEDDLGNPIDYRFIEVNSTFEAHTGLKDAVGKTIKEFFPDLEKSWIELYGRVAKTGESKTFEQGSLAMGRIFKVEAVKVGASHSRRVAVLFSDVTDRRRAAESLQDREAKLKLGLAVANVGLAEIDYGSNTITLDETCAALFDLQAHTPIPRSELHARFHPDERDLIESKILALLQPDGPDVMAIDHRIVVHKRTTKWVTARKHLEYTYDDQGVRKPKSGLLAVQDVTHRYETANALLESAARLRHAADAAHLSYFEIDLKNQRIRYGENFASVMGYVLPPTNDQWIGFEVSRQILMSHVDARDRATFETGVNYLISGNQADPIEYRVLGDDGAERWIETTWSVQYTPQGALTSVFATNLDITEQKRAEQSVRMLMSEVNHRSKNLLAVVLSVVRQTARHGDLTTLPQRISDRVAALAANQDLLVQNLWEGIDVDELVTAQLSHFKELIGTRVMINGPEVTLSPSAAQGVGMALHELATNAGKYGALSNMCGCLNISWSIDENKSFCMQWQELEGPIVTQPTTRGFGQTVIGPMVEAALNGRVVVNFRPTGVVWTLISPVESTLHKFVDQ